MEWLAYNAGGSRACQRVVKLCLVTAQRVGEVAGMAVDELDLENATWTIPAARSKNKRLHRVPLSTSAIEIIREALIDAGSGVAYVFPNEAGDAGLNGRAVARIIIRARGRIGLPHWTMHDLRRTALTNFAKLGIAPIVAGAVANHSSVTRATITLAVYTRFTYEPQKREALDLWADRLTALTSKGCVDASALDGKSATVHLLDRPAGNPASGNHSQDRCNDRHHSRPRRPAIAAQPRVPIAIPAVDRGAHRHRGDQGLRAREGLGER